eukprot:CAMPEP_0117663638 /NCGR_PEP_ID=MMETSP0804-20121206/8735_1 /TAXON_ID=1074897 /ORGANISM="Tetraselmis astigmatica, Strain CCMP880" /LENGTH=437 /DNA_ID=CAMNT_0005470701 /DNA_START=124 /DNA_END=1437 /DNA_ORIENTATION=-
MPPPLDLGKGQFSAAMEFDLQDAGRDLDTPSIVRPSSSFPAHEPRNHSQANNFSAMRPADTNMNTGYGLHGLGGFDDLVGSLGAPDQHLQLLTKMPPAALRELHALVSQAVHTQTTSSDGQQQQHHHHHHPPNLQQNQPGSTNGTPNSHPVRSPVPQMSRNLTPQAATLHSNYHQMPQQDGGHMAMGTSPPMNANHCGPSGNMAYSDSPNPRPYGMGAPYGGQTQDQTLPLTAGRQDFPAVKRIQELKREAPPPERAHSNKDRGHRRRPLQVIGQGNGLEGLPPRGEVPNPATALASHQLDTQEEMIISPRSARMLIDCVSEDQGANIMPNDAGRDANGEAPFSTCSAVTDNERQMPGTGMNLIDAQTAFGWGPGFETPRRHPRLRELSLLPFDAILRNYTDTVSLKDFNGWMASKADDTGRQFSFDHSESVYGSYS